MDQLQKELDRARRYGSPFVLFFDGDRFKKVNDMHGHAAGDTVLRQIGERAGSMLRGGDTLGRFGVLFCCPKLMPRKPQWSR